MVRFRALLPTARLAISLASLTLFTLPAAASPPRAQRSPGDVTPLRTLMESARSARRAAQTPAVGETVWVFRDSLENKSSPSNEGGWSHQDASFEPVAWHIDTLMACEGHSFWCGRVDSSWVNDPDRRGYDNSWNQTLQNYVDLTGAVSPVNLSFSHRMDVEPGFDFVELHVLDPVESWVFIASFTGVIEGPGQSPCDSFTVQIPDSIIAKYTTPLVFRFVFKSDIVGSSADGLYPGEGYALDNVTVMAGLGDLRFFDDFESGMGTWQVTIPPVAGDYWRIQAGVVTEQLCTTNSSKVWTGTNQATGSLVSNLDDKLIAPPVAVNHADQVFAAFDAYRSLPMLACFYYGARYRTRNVGDPSWSAWADPTGLLYFGNEKEWLRQTIAIPGAGGKDSVQVLLELKDYADIFCGGQSSPGGTALFIDNFAVGTIGLAPPTIVASEQNLFNDTFQTTVFLEDDNFNTPSGDSVSVRLSASRGLKAASLHWSLNGGSFSGIPLTAVGPLVPTAYYADVPPGSYARGTELRYYLSATDSLDETTTLPSDALSASHYFTATILPAIQPSSTSCGGDSATVLYVNAFAGLTGPTPLDSSLAAIGVRYDRFDVNDPASSLANTPGGAPPGDPGEFWPPISMASLGKYGAIIWDVGERSSGTLSHEDQQLLQTWLNLPGRNRGLLIAGDNLAFDLIANQQDIGTFLACALGVTYLRDIWETTPQDSLTPSLAGAQGTRIASEPFPLAGDCPGINRFDALQPSPCAGPKARPWLAYPNALVAGVEMRDSVGVVADTSRSVLLGSSLTAIPSAVRRNLFLYRTVVEEFEVPSCYVASGVDVPSAAASPALRLNGAAPNPFNPSTAIRFTLGRPAKVRIQVFDVSGALVRVLMDSFKPAGEHRVLWDGRDGRGHDLASGAYFYRVEAAGTSEARKLILLR